MPQMMQPVFKFRAYRVAAWDKFEPAIQHKGKAPHPAALTEGDAEPAITPAQLVELMNDLQDSAKAGPVHIIMPDSDGSTIVMVSELVKMAVIDVGGGLVMPGAPTVHRT
jgi:hypothetical protein